MSKVSAKKSDIIVSDSVTRNNALKVSKICTVGTDMTILSVSYHTYIGFWLLGQINKFSSLPH